MTEITGLFRKDPDNDKAIKVKATLGQRMNVGGEGNKSFAKTRVSTPDGNERYAGKYFMKLLDSELVHAEISPRNIVRKYQWLKKRGYPVVSTLRYDSTSNSLIMTDLTEGGKKLFVDRHYCLPHYNLSVRQIENWGSVKTELKNLAINIFNDGMALDDDNYALILEKSGKKYKAKIFLVDLGYGAYILSEQAPKFRTIDDQIEWADLFLHKIQTI